VTWVSVAANSVRRVLSCRFCRAFSREAFTGGASGGGVFSSMSEMMPPGEAPAPADSNKRSTLRADVTVPAQEDHGPASLATSPTGVEAAAMRLSAARLNLSSSWPAVTPPGCPVRDLEPKPHDVPDESS